MMPDIIEALRSALSEQDAAKVLHIANEVVKQHDEGLIPVLPCEIGSTIYDIYEFVENRTAPEIYEYKAETIEFGKDKHGDYFVIDSMILRPDDFGKTVFLTREEAEKVLNPDAGITTTEQRSVKSNEQS